MTEDWQVAVAAAYIERAITDADRIEDNAPAYAWDLAQAMFRDIEQQLKDRNHPTGKKRIVCTLVTEVMCETGLFHHARSCQMEAAPIAKKVVDRLESEGYLKFD